MRFKTAGIALPGAWNVNEVIEYNKLNRDGRQYNQIHLYNTANCTSKSQISKHRGGNNRNITKRLKTDTNM